MGEKKRGRRVKWESPDALADGSDRIGIGIGIKIST
jgi:hypothetical protein